MSDAVKGRSKTAPLHTELRNVRIIPNGKRICQHPFHPPQKKERRGETEATRVAPRTAQSAPVLYHNENIFVNPHPPSVPARFAEDTKRTPCNSQLLTAKAESLLRAG